jgi:sulfate/thiosulfate transport system substrate-binding protein
MGKVDSLIMNRTQDIWGRARLRGSIIAAGVLAAAVGLAACGGSDDSADGSNGGGGGGSIDVVAYSTPQEVYVDELIPAFQETPDGEGTEFSTSFAGSGDARRAVEAGQPADFVHLPLEPDMDILAEEDLIPSDYRDTEYDGSPQSSVVVFVTRPGNPEGVETWDDLVQGDLEVINANPFTSGGARWNVMAAYGQVVENGASEQEGLDYVRQLFERIPVQDASARDALNTFLGGKGDVLLSYENEAIQAQSAGEDVDYVIPDDTIKIETLDSVTTDAANPEGGQAFRDFLVSEEGQQIWAENGYRPVDEQVLEEFRDDFPEPRNLFTIEDLGGWDAVMEDFFDVENGKIADIQRDLGVAVE